MKRITSKLLLISLFLGLGTLSTGCTEFVEYDRPEVPPELDIPPIEEKFAAMVGTLNAVTHFADHLNLPSKTANSEDPSTSLSFFSEDQAVTNDDPFLEEGGDHGNGIFEGDPEFGGTVSVARAETEFTEEGLRTIKGKIQLDSWRAPEAAHFKWDDYRSVGLSQNEQAEEAAAEPKLANTSSDVVVSTADGEAATVSITQIFEIQGLCVDTEINPVIPIELNYDIYGEYDGKKALCEEDGGTYDTTDGVCGFPIYNKASCEEDPVFGDKIPWQRWIPFVPHCSVPGRVDRFECSGKNLSWTGSICVDASNNEKTSRRPANEAECFAAEAAEEESVGTDATGTALDEANIAITPFTWSDSLNKCQDDNEDDVVILLNTSDTCLSDNGTWQGGTGYCKAEDDIDPNLEEIKYEGKEDCLSQNDSTWTEIPVLGRLSELVYDTGFQLDKDDTQRGWPVNSGLYSGSFTTVIESSGNTYQLEFTDFFYEAVFVEKVDFEADTVVEVLSYTYNGEVTINGQKYDIKENIIVRIPD